MYVYGHQRFTDDIEEMTGVRPGLYWQLTWRFIAPVMLTGLLLMSIIKTITSSPEYSSWIEADVSFVLSVWICTSSIQYEFHEFFHQYFSVFSN